MFPTEKILNNSAVKLWGLPYRVQFVSRAITVLACLVIKEIWGEADQKAVNYRK